ncbi:hypothetical protein [Cyanobium gracile]|uniref:Uncharacterized protein n=1 Tax=Cyanobium gracile UHCC 0281 TaxID=3110309 RepID=A0ABU5SSJ2_9CYAN|nr:hypothetical protein [Cyanobium gracile]MEA5441454.1 hypothetical protein [Cyanobium gracile UHCC 0281]
MKASLSFPRWRRLQLPLLVALALNGLLLLLPALRPAQRSVASRAAIPADDTPELLRFSRQQAREPALPLLALPSLSSLPPPPPTDLPPEPRAGAASRRRGTDAHRVRTQDRVASATAAEREAAQDRPLSRAGAEPTAVSTLLALALQARPLEASEATALAGLWEQATATRESPEGMVVPAEGVEWRRLPLAKARAAGLPVRDPLAVLSGDKLLLLWPEGTALWMLAAAGESKTVSATP